MKKIILYIILGSSLIANSYFIYETTYLKKHIQYIEQENENLKETPEIYWQKAIEKFNNKNYTETKEILNKLIEKFPTSSLVKTSQDKIKEIKLIEKKKKEEEQRIIKSLPKQIANAKNAFYAERILNDLDSKYDDTYPELKDVIKKERDKVREKEAKRIIQSLPKQVKNSKSALEAEKMLENIRTKYGSYPGVQQAIGEEKAKIREKIEKEKEVQRYLNKAEEILQTLCKNKDKLNDRTETVHSITTKLYGKPDSGLVFNSVLFGKNLTEIFLTYGKTFGTNISLGALLKGLKKTPLCIYYVDGVYYKDNDSIREAITVYYFGRRYNPEKRRFEKESVSDSGVANWFL